ncbi:uncharacterized protein PHALS_00626 [Plasmopara halstedii]|uniref:RxLR-like protein n=1 Tax=Plasmopara halstedii TaxID=4781 RepID=A0A0N7L8P9_PLAHL|nr:uncharacterized protein PHALS_00626 [Plasmopara halstedii]CEG50483.1 hypothetical protein PHALS_00626 [Plasmopara halstedii]|eukprot:XP_024586852.1 hypothetical protein PHALS_00626 [Plasmopara halstedii]
MPWLMHFSLALTGLSLSTSRPSLSRVATREELVWAYASVYEVTDVPSDIVVSHVHAQKDESYSSTGGGAVRRRKKTVSIDMNVMVDGCMTNSGTIGKDPSREKNKRATKKSTPSSILRTPDQGRSFINDESDQEQDISSEFVNVVAYNEESDVDVIRLRHFLDVVT